MNGNLLVTASLLDNFNFYCTCPPAWKAKALKELTATLRREPYEVADWVKRGIDFENTVYDVCNNLQKRTAGSSYFNRVVELCKGGDYQAKEKKYVNADGHAFVFYGKLDVKKPDEIIDIKTTLNYKGESKYLSGTQHLLYPWLTGISHFRYVVVQWENEDSHQIKHVYEIASRMTDSAKVQDALIAKAVAFTNWTIENGLYNDYYKTFSYN